MVVLGIDPGLANTGWGVVEERRGICRCRAYGCIHTTTEADLAARLRHIVDELVSVVDRYQTHAARASISGRMSARPSPRHMRAALRSLPVPLRASRWGNIPPCRLSKRLWGRVLQISVR